ncbi:hypothetical protein CLONEX_01513 [[Clostridium] nexile DSM 1787]|nr:hypothetical protein CLONEX_01513 [[Clostridium] nexile DSM 1787]
MAELLLFFFFQNIIKDFSFPVNFENQSIRTTDNKTVPPTGTFIPFWRD